MRRGEDDDTSPRRSSAEGLGESPLKTQNFDTRINDIGQGCGSNMCGIIGGFDRTGRPFSDAQIEAACQRMGHRGPDDQGVFAEPGVFLANRRLANALTWIGLIKHFLVTSDALELDR